MPSATSDVLYFTRCERVNNTTTNGFRPTKITDSPLLFNTTALPDTDRITGVKRLRKFGFGTVSGYTDPVTGIETEYTFMNPVFLSLYYDLPNYYIAFLTQGATLEQQFDAIQSDIPVNTAGVPTGRLYNPGYLTQSAALGTSTVIVDTRRGEYKPFRTGDMLAFSQSHWTTTAGSPRWQLTLGTTGNEIYEFASATSVSYVGDVATIQLAQPLNNTIRKQSFISACIPLGEEITNHTGTVSVTRGSGNNSNGTFDATNHPIVVHPTGGIAQKWTLSFTSNFAFKVIGDTKGEVTSGNISGDCIPINPDNNKPYFTLPSSGWTGTFAAGDAVTFYTFIQQVVVWEYIEVPPNTPSINETKISRGIKSG